MKKLLLKTWLLLACLLLGVGTSWAEEYSFTVQTSDFNTTSYAANNGSHDFTATCKTDASKTMTVACTTNQIMQSSSVMQWQKNAGYIYNTTDLGTIKSVTVNSSAGTFTTNYGTTEHPTSGTTVGNGFFTVKVGDATGKTSSIVVVFEKNTSGTTPSGPTVTAPIFDVAAGTYTEDKLVLIDNYNSDYLYAYTLDGTDPAFDENLDVTSGTAYDNNEGIEITSSCTLKAIAVDEDGNASSISSAVYTINKPQVFASLEDLVAADITTGTTVTVSFENVPIKSIFTTAQGYRNGVYFDIQKGGKDIEIYYQNVPEEWVAGGTLSGTMTCPWKLYNGTWELAPDKDTWAWTNLTYIKKTITALVVSGTPTKTTYNVGDAFDTAGLVVTATYSDNTQAPITDGFEWEIDYGKTGEVANTAFVAGATSVDVMVSTEDNVMSDVYTVNGLTVNVPVTLTSIAVSGTPTKTEYYAGDAFETAGLVVTGTYSDSHQETITEGIEWTIEPETLALGITSVDVIAGVGAVVSEVYTVEGLTVTKAPFETVTYNFSSFTSGTTVELTNLEGFVITLKGNGGTNPAWSSNQARVYAKGSLSVKANNATIKSIEYTYEVNANKNGVSPTIDGVAGTTTAGTWDVENKTWTGADEEVTFSTSGTAGNIGFTKLVIKYSESTRVETSLAWSADEATVTIGADDNEFPTLTTTPVDLAGVTYESDNSAVATIAADGTITLVKAGETTITARYAGDAEYAPASPVSYTLTVNKAPFVPTPAEDGYEMVDFTTIYSSDAIVEDYEGTSFSMAFAKPQSSSTPTKYYTNGSAVRAYTGNTITITGAENITNVDIAWSGNYVDDNVSITGLGTTTAVVTFSKTCRFTAIIVCYRSETITLAATDGTDYYATFSSDKAVVFEDEATVYAVSAEGNALTLNEITGKKVPANTGVLVKTSGTSATYHYVLNAATVEENALYPASKDKSELEGYKFYMLAYGDEALTHSTLGFYYGAEDGAAFTSRVGSAYLAIPAEQAARAGFSFADDAEGIEDVTTEHISTTIYTLNGVKVNEPQKGLNIVNGKKVMVRE